MSRTKKRVLIVAAIFMAAAALMFFFSRNQDLSENLRYLSYPYDALSNAITSIMEQSREVLDAAEENKRLRDDLQTAIMDNQSYNEIVAENRRLRELLHLKALIDSGGTAARVVGRGYDRLANTLIINKGLNHGIAKNMPVITANGLAGKVLNVRKNFADIILINDLNFSVAVRLKESRHEGILSGSSRSHCILKYVPIEEPVKNGDIVITSGLDGIFQPGIPVGTVTKVQTEGVEFFQYIEVTPFQNPSKIEEALVVHHSAVFKDMRAADSGHETPTPEAPGDK
jgi:rod shape-determining protein MreC